MLNSFLEAQKKSLCFVTWPKLEFQIFFNEYGYHVDCQLRIMSYRFWVDGMNMNMNSAKK